MPAAGTPIRRASASNSLRAISDLLKRVHRIPDAQVDLIPHGHPARRRRSREQNAARRGRKTVILTFGLLSRDKGIEHVIEALQSADARGPRAAARCGVEHDLPQPVRQPGPGSDALKS
jgi:glycosyltransferase involved in cell wall biosynthesis